jgi:anti-anti-sigma factor
MRSTLAIEGAMTIHRARELRRLLEDALTPSGGIDVDLSRVSEIDSAGVQLIVAARKQAFADGKDMRIVAHSAAVVEVLELLDLHMCLGLGGVACSRCSGLNKCFTT